jgi:hypothetical protein
LMKRTLQTNMLNSITPVAEGTDSLKEREI